MEVFSEFGAIQQINSIFGFQSKFVSKHTFDIFISNVSKPVLVKNKWVNCE